MPRADFTIAEILCWADSYRQATGRWPDKTSGRIPGTVCESWAIVEEALRTGKRGFLGGSSLARFLAERRGKRNIASLAPLSEDQILDWADGHYQRTGSWPSRNSGTIPGTSGETWARINAALSSGCRGLPSGTTLPRLLAQRRGARLRRQLPPLNEDQIVAWAEAHRRHTGQWPTVLSGPIMDSPGESWRAMNTALDKGRRGLPGGTSLAQLLLQRCGNSLRGAWAPLTVEQILKWADAHYSRTGAWPKINSGAILDAPGQNWSKVSQALRVGLRGLPPGSSLAKLLAECRGVRTRITLPRLTMATVLRWADAHRRRTGTWPTQKSGPIADAPSETWPAIDDALRLGQRGLPGGSSLVRLLAQRRGRRPGRGVPLSIRRILVWADAHYQRTGRWPTAKSGPVAEAPGETWAAINAALKAGYRGLACRSSLARLLARKRGLQRRGIGSAEPP